MAALLGPMGAVPYLELAGAGGAMLLAGLSDRREYREVFNLFGGLARLMDAASIFLDQLSGPRSQVRNPLLRQILEVADRLAPLIALGLGAVAVVIRRIGPVLQPVARMLVALGGLARATFAALGDILAGLMQRIDELTSGPLSLSNVVNRVTSTAQLLFERTADALTEQLDAIAATLGALGPALGAAFGTFLDDLGDFIKKLFTESSVGKSLLAFRTQLDVFMPVWKNAPEPEKKKDEEPSFFQPLIDALPKLPELPEFPALPTLPTEAQREQIKKDLGVVSLPELSIASIEATAAGLGARRTTHLELGEDARKALERSLRRPSIFAPERRALEQELGKPPAEALTLSRERLGQFREALSVVVGRVLPPEMRAVYAPLLAETLGKIDKQLYGVETAPSKKLPVLDLPTSDRLQPEVKSFVLRMPGAELNDVKHFQDLVLERLRRQEYTAGSAAPVPAGAQ
jgi:hypothetical protein